MLSGFCGSILVALSHIFLATIFIFIIKIYQYTLSFNFGLNVIFSNKFRLILYCL